MSWNKYRDQYRDLWLALNQADIITFVASSALKDFPKNIPKDLLKGMPDALREFSAIMEGAAEAKDCASRGKFPEPFFSLFTINVLLREGRSQFDYEQALARQQLVMLLAHTEAFIGDSIRAICKARPEILTSSQKQITWESALSFPDRDSLLDFLTEEYISVTMRSKDLGGVLSILKKDHGLDLVIQTEHLSTLSLTEQIRHLIVHTGSQIDAKFIKKTGLTAEDIDKPFSMHQATKACLFVAQSVFKAVSKKFYGISHPLKEVGFTIRKAKAESAH